MLGSGGEQGRVDNTFRAKSYCRTLSSITISFTEGLQPKSEVTRGEQKASNTVSLTTKVNSKSCTFQAGTVFAF
jgi:hypothetical protein